MKNENFEQGISENCPYTEPTPLETAEIRKRHPRTIDKKRRDQGNCGFVYTYTIDRPKT